MRAIWGPVTEIRDLGVVAEQCPHCERVRTCLLRSVCRGYTILFVRTTEPTVERSGLCTACLKTFPCDHWRYTTALPIQQAKTLTDEELLARTNPGLAECLLLTEQIRALGGDARFAVAYEHLGGIRPGATRSRLLAQLLDWVRLAEGQRSALEQQIIAQARAWRLARQVAPEFPVAPVFLTTALAALVVGAVLLGVPSARSWLWGGVTVVAGLAAAALGAQVLLRRKVRRWTHEVLVQEAQHVNVSLTSFLAVVDDVPGSRLGMLEELWPLKDQRETIHAELLTGGKL
jgi:hypothetical protein